MFVGRMAQSRGVLFLRPLFVPFFPVPCVFLGGFLAMLGPVTDGLLPIPPSPPPVVLSVSGLSHFRYFSPVRERFASLWVTLGMPRWRKRCALL